jgi:hypothetical protein
MRPETLEAAIEIAVARSKRRRRTIATPWRAC